MVWSGPYRRQRNSEPAFGIGTVSSRQGAKSGARRPTIFNNPRSTICVVHRLLGIAMLVYLNSAGGSAYLESDAQEGVNLDIREQRNHRYAEFTHCRSDG